MSTEALLMLSAVLGLLLLSAPLFLLIGFSTALGYVLFEDSAWMAVEFGESMRKLTDKPPLLAVPFFVLSGAIMSRGAIADRLVGVARAVFSGVPGGLGIATVIACMFFAAISGSSPVTVITIGGVMYPALVKAGYTERFSTGLVTSAGTLGILIPPSIPMIVYAIFASGTQVIQVEDLFLAGVGPGILIGGLLSVYCLGVGWSRGERFAKSDESIVERLIEGFWSLMLPVVILGGIYSGMFTATEAAAISVVYSILVEVLIHRSLKLNDLPAVIGESTILMGSLLVIFAMAVGLNDLLAELQLPDRAAAWIKTQELTPFKFMLLLNGFLLIVGCLMDIMSAIMILVPLLTPMAASYGIDPIHLGIVFIVNLELGYLTPPMGLNLFVSSSLFNKSIGEVIRSVIPTLAILAIALLCVTYVPTISLGPGRLIRGLQSEAYHSGEKSLAEVIKSSWVSFPDESEDSPSAASETQPQATEPPKPKGGLSIQEMMRMSGELDDEETDDEETDDEETDDDEEKVKSKPKSIQELMREQNLDDLEGMDDEE